MNRRIKNIFYSQIWNWIAWWGCISLIKTRVIRSPMEKKTTTLNNNRFSSLCVSRIHIILWVRTDSISLNLTDDLRSVTIIYSVARLSKSPDIQIFEEDKSTISTCVQSKSIGKPLTLVCWPSIIKEEQWKAIIFQVFFMMNVNRTSIYQMSRYFRI